MEKTVVTVTQFKIGVVGYCPPTKFDESDTFLAECNVLVRIGGGKQSRDEVAAFGAKGGTVYERELAALPG